MKTLATLLTVLSLSVASVGCGGGEEPATKKEAGKTDLGTPTDDPKALEGGPKIPENAAGKTDSETEGKTDEKTDE